MKAKTNIFYVYMVFSSQGCPLYVGKGKGDRWAEGGRHNAHMRAVWKKYGSLPVVIIRDDLTEQQAFDTEKALVAVIGRSDLGKGPLANHTDGGEGVTGRSGFKMPRESVERGAAKRRGRKYHTFKMPLDAVKRSADKRRGQKRSEQIKQSISERLLGRPMPDEVKKKISASTKGKPKPEGFGEKISKASKGKPKKSSYRPPHSEETKRKISATLTGRVGHPHTPESIEKIRNRHAGRAFSPEHKAKISAAKKRAVASAKR